MLVHLVLLLDRICNNLASKPLSVPSWVFLEHPTLVVSGTTPMTGIPLWSKEEINLNTIICPCLLPDYWWNVSRSLKLLLSWCYIHVVLDLSFLKIFSSGIFIPSLINIINTGTNKSFLREKIKYKIIDNYVWILIITYYRK